MNEMDKFLIEHKERGEVVNGKERGYNGWYGGDVLIAVIGIKNKSLIQNYIDNSESELNPSMGLCSLLSKNSKNLN